MADPVNLNLKMDDTTAKGVHGTDVLIITNEKEICLTFYVYTSPTEAIVTSRVFLPLSTAHQMAEIIKKRIEPGLHQYQDWLKKLPPSSEDSTSGGKNSKS